MEAFYRTHIALIDTVESPVRRTLMDEIDWKDRLIAIKGSRGVGKTTFLLQYAKEHYGHSRKCLYINFNNFYFTEHSLVEFAKQFVEQGGETLLIDQTFKYENWSAELRQCYDLYPNLHIIFSCSPVMRLTEDNKDLQDIVKMYNLRGLSFREYLNLHHGTQLKVIKLEDIIQNHANIAQDICENHLPKDFQLLNEFSEYLHHGYYPFHLEKRNYYENLLKTINMMIEVDILIIKQIDVSYLAKIRKLLHILMQTAPCSPNVSKFSLAIDTSRATIMNYIKYLKDARLLNLLYREGDVFPKKPTKIYMQNTNLMYATAEGDPKPQDVAETYFYNTLHACHKINATDRNELFVVDGRWNFNVFDHYDGNVGFHLTACGGFTIGEGNKIPLWLLGFLY
ncbi:MAG: ATP-binding protein [Paludibacteraceae bacterium]|nr:ATP-binding protein [Paludibacteraceae bacterium]